MVLIALPAPKKSENIHQLSIESIENVSKTLGKFTVSELSDFNSFIKKNKNYSVHSITQYLQKYPHNWELLFWFLPYSTHLEMYINNSFSGTYYNQKIVDDILKMNQISLTYTYLNLLNQPELASKNINLYMINLTNRFGSKFSFAGDRFLERLNKFQNLWDDLDWSDIIIGTDLILFLASDLEIDSKEQYNYQFNVYSKKTRRSVGKYPVYFDKDLKYHYQPNENIKISLCHYCRVIDDVLQVLLEKLETIVYDVGSSSNKILTTCEFYQMNAWDQDHVYQVNQLNKSDFVEHNIRKRCHVYLSASKTDIKHDFVKYLNDITLNVSGSKHPKCYICNKYFNRYLVPERYNHHCMECGILEHTKLVENVDLSSLKVYVSGCRIKIGYSTVLRFLRLGSKVIGSTRFPKLAWMNFQKESDFMMWKDRLVIIRADFNSFSDVNRLTAYLAKEKINVLINNACQTIRPSREYLDTLGEAERTLQLEYVKPMNHQLDVVSQPQPPAMDIMLSTDSPQNQLELEIFDGSSIVPYVNAESASINLKLNRYGDIDDIQGKQSTWFKTIDQLDPTEIIEVISINQLVPTLLINQLKPTMTQPAFIINVTAVEGQFNTTSKDSYHPHTNMAKAAINMMIRTMSEEKNPSVLAYAIDPGFVSGVRERTLKTGITPIQSDDGASRVIDPVVEWFKNNKLDPGKYRHYKKDVW